MNEVLKIKLKDQNNKEDEFFYHQYFDKFLDMKPWLHINKTEWNYIKNNIEESLIKDSLTILLSKYSFPYKDISLDEVKNEFIKLQNLDTNKLISDVKWFSRSIIDKELSDIVFTSTNIGSKCSNYFHQENRMKTELENSPSQYRTWTTPKFVRTLVNSFFTMKKEEINMTTVKSCLDLRKGVASQFKPSIAKLIYDKYNSENILDFSAGWGDRLCGFYTCKKGKNYLGIDPNSNVHIGYKKQIDLYSELCGDDRKAKTIISPAEDIDLSNYKDKFDTVFTSPPYFNREKYTNDNTQSWFRYRAIEDWLDNFLFKTINNIEPTIKNGGVLIINISDVCSNSKGRKKKEWLEICNPMINYVESLNKFKLEDIIGYKLTKKPNLKSAGTGLKKFNENLTFAEPIFVWRKL